VAYSVVFSVAVAQGAAVFWSLHRCGGDVFVLDLLSVAGSRRSAVSCFCDVVHVLSCLAMLCVAGAPRATVLMSL
jgi:hypothetical protein